MASTRLRRTFNYPADSDDDDAVEEGMDSQDQERVLNKLSTHDKSSTTLYTKLLLAFPLLPALLSIPQLFHFQTSLQSSGAIASLLATAYTLWFLPLPPMRIKVTSVSELPKDDAINNSNNNVRDRGGRRSSETSSKAKRRAMARSATGFSSAPTPRPDTIPRPVPYISDQLAAGLATYIIPGNAALCLLFAVLELWRGRAWGVGVGVGGGYLPGLVLVVVLWARRELRAVDLGELERLRYRRT